MLKLKEFYIETIPGKENEIINYIKRYVGCENILILKHKNIISVEKFFNSKKEWEELKDKLMKHEAIQKIYLV